MIIPFIRKLYPKKKSWFSQDFYLYIFHNMLEQSHTSPKKEVKIKTVPEILLCHFSCKTSAKVIIKFLNRHLRPHFFI